MNETELILLGEEDTRVTFRMKKDLLRKLKVYAAQNDTNVTDILNNLAEEFLDKDNSIASKTSGHQRTQ